MDYPSDPKRRKVYAPDITHGGVAPRTLDDINIVLKEHSRQIEALAAANKVLEGRNAALEERCKALDRKSVSLERSCDELEVRCSSLERSVQVLKKDVDWTYTAPCIPRSHWIEQGRNEEYADIMEQFPSLVKDNVERIRNGEEDYYGTCLDYYGEMTVLHDNVLLPHFKELADAMQLSSGIRNIAIENIELHPSALSILFPATEGKVTIIDIRDIAFPSADIMECYEIIAKSIRRNHKLGQLMWSSIEFPSNEQENLLIQSVIDNLAIKNVNLDNCFNQSEANGCGALTSLLTSGRPFGEIDFGENGLSGIDNVAAALATNPQVEALSICDNELNDRDAELITEALKQNTNLQRLYLSSNNITPAGFEGIGAAIYDPSSLNAMASCNHTCWIDCVKDDYTGGFYKLLSPQYRRRRKLYKPLSTRHAEGSNDRHLNAELGGGPIGVKLVPRVLVCIHQCLGGRSEILSICFELMRSWKMPELYEHRGTFEDD